MIKEHIETNEREKSQKGRKRKKHKQTYIHTYDNEKYKINMERKQPKEICKFVILFVATTHENAQPIQKIYNMNTTTNKIGCLLRFSCRKRAASYTFPCTKKRAHTHIHTFAVASPSFSVSILISCFMLFHFCDFVALCSQCLHFVREFIEKQNKNERESENGRFLRKPT